MTAKKIRKKFGWKFEWKGGLMGLIHYLYICNAFFIQLVLHRETLLIIKRPSFVSQCKAEQEHGNDLL